jgi:glyoxylase I family protein
VISRIHHTGIVTQQLVEMRRFYCDVLGFEHVVDFEWDIGRPEIDAMLALHASSARASILRIGGTLVELVEYASPAGRPPVLDRPNNDAGITHLCFEVDDLKAEYERLAAAGMHFNSRPIAPAPDARTGVSVRTAYGRDPDGNSIELLEIEAGGAMADG